MFLDYSKIDSFNCLLNIVLGARGCGKTFGAKLKVIRNYLKNGEHFVYLRRTNEELKQVAKTLFNDVNCSGLVDIQIKYDKGYFVDDKGKIVGYAMCLSKSGNYKSASYPLVTTLIFDEFLTDKKGNGGYLRNETKLLLDMIETVFRMRDKVKVYMLSNSISLNNPYTIGWDLYLNKGKTYMVKDDILFMVLESEEYSNAKAKTRLGKLYASLDSEYNEYAVNNKLLFDDNNFIEKKSGKLSYIFTFIVDGSHYGVWKNFDTGICYISRDTDNNCPMILTLKAVDHLPNTQLIKDTKGNVFYDFVIKPYEFGNLRFETKRIKNETLQLFKEYY